MAQKTKLKMGASIAGTVDGDVNFSAQVGDVIEIGSDTARKWIASGLATRAAEGEPLTSSSDLLRDLSVEEAMRRRCSSCDQRRAKFVLGNRPYCGACYRAHLEG